MEQKAEMRLPQRSDEVIGPEVKNVIAAAVKADKKRVESKIDRQLKDSFPASDPPSYSGGKHIVGAPEERESGAATQSCVEVKSAEKKVKDGTAKHPAKY